MKLTDSIDQKIVKLHHEIKRDAAEVLIKVFQVGMLLNKKRVKFEHGQWLPYLADLEIDAETARRYMAVASHYSTKTKLLQEGKSLIELYRSLGLVKALEGGGNRNGKSEAEAQIYFNFDAFDGLMRVAVAKDQKEGNPFLKVSADQLTETRNRTVQALTLMDAALAEKEAITV